MKMGTVSGTKDVVSQSLKVRMGGCRTKAASLLLGAQPVSCVRGPGGERPWTWASSDPLPGPTPHTVGQHGLLEEWENPTFPKRYPRSFKSTQGGRVILCWHGNAFFKAQAHPESTLFWPPGNWPKILWIRDEARSRVSPHSPHITTLPYLSLLDFLTNIYYLVLNFCLVKMTLWQSYRHI